MALKKGEPERERKKERRGAWLGGIRREGNAMEEERDGQSYKERRR